MHLEPPRGHWQRLAEGFQLLGTAGNLATDAHLATLAISYDAELYSNDQDFGRFTGLRWINPLV